MNLVYLQPSGLYCKEGDFYIDPVRGVTRAVITHGHGDHARFGSKEYWAAKSSVPILNHRLGEQKLNAVPYGEKIKMGNTWVSFHPAGHVLGSSQIRIECKNKVWVVSGDYKRTYDPSCEPFEVVECDTFVTESTFGLPIYDWKSGAEVAQEIFQWWQSHTGPTILFCYAFGKAQRILAELSKLTTKTIYLHKSILTLTDLYRQAGVVMAPTLAVDFDQKKNFDGELILAPPPAHKSSWMKKIKNAQTGFASGWMQIRSNKKRRGYEKGFTLSDHADWKELLQTIEQSKAKKVYVTHGQNSVFARYLREVRNIDAQPLETMVGEGLNE